MGFAEWWQGLLHGMRHRLSRRSPELMLGHRNLYILPSGFGCIWLLSTAALYVLGINSRSNTPVLLAFLMLGLMLLGLFLTHMNLQGLRLRVMPQESGFSGQELTYWIETESRYWRPSLSWKWLTESAPPEQSLHISPGRQRLSLSWMSSRRGKQTPGRLLLQTTAPLGLFRCWCYWEPPEPIWVAPARRSGPVQEHNPNQLPGTDLFSDLRPWREEEGPQRLDWKAKARGRGLFSKRFSSPSSPELWLAPVPYLPLERALEHLCHKVTQDLSGGSAVGLALPNGQWLAPAKGPGHLQRCLQVLAEWPPCA